MHDCAAAAIWAKTSNFDGDFNIGAVWKRRAQEPLRALAIAHAQLRAYL